MTDRQTFSHRFPYYVFYHANGERKQFPAEGWQAKWERFFCPLEKRRKERREPRKERRLFGPRLLCLLREERKEQRRKGEQRNPPNPLWCEVCERFFPNRHELSRHLPCRAGDRKTDPGLFDAITEWKKAKGKLNWAQTKFVLGMLAASTSYDVFLSACDHGDFSYEDGHAAFQRAMFLQFLARFRPEVFRREEFGAVNPTQEQVTESDRIAEQFFAVPETALLRRRGILSQIFNPEIPLQRIAVNGQGRPTAWLREYDEIARPILAKCEGKHLAAKLADLGVTLSDGSTPLQLYEGDGNRFTNMMQFLRRRLKIRRRPR